MLSWLLALSMHWKKTSINRNKIARTLSLALLTLNNGKTEKRPFVRAKAFLVILQVALELFPKEMGLF